MLTRKWLQIKRAGPLRCVESNYRVESWHGRDLPTTCDKVEVRSWLRWQRSTRRLNTRVASQRLGEESAGCLPVSFLSCGVDSSFLFDFSLLPVVLRFELIDIETQQQSPWCTVNPARSQISNLEIIPVPIIRRPT